MISSKLIVIAGLSLGLAACSVDSKKDKGASALPTDYARTAGTSFNVDGLAVTSSTLIDTNSYGLPKKKVFSFKSCVTDITGTAVPPGVMFRISDKAGSVLDRATDLKGCLQWTENFQFNYFNHERFFKFARVITPKAVFRGAITIEAAFDPWLDGQAAMVDPRPAGGTAMGTNPVDIGALSLHGASVQKPGDSSDLNVNVDVVNFDFNGLDYPNYEATPSLDLKVAHKYLVRFKPSVVRSTISKAAAPESFIGGSMKVYIVIFREQPDFTHQYEVQNVVSVNEFVVSDDKHVGTFSAMVTLKFDNVVQLTSRSAALVTFVPMGDDVDGLGEFTMKGVLKPGRLSTLNLVPSTHFNARTIAEDYAKHLKSLPSSQGPLQELIAKENMNPMGLKPLTVKDSYGHSNVVDIGGAVRAWQQDKKNEMSAAVKREICWQLIGNQTNAKSVCMGNMSAIEFHRKEFVDKVLEAPKKSGLTTLTTLKTSVSFAEAISRSSTWDGQVSGSVGLSAGIGNVWPPKPPIVAPGSPAPPAPSPISIGSLGRWFSWVPGLKLSVGGQLSYVYDIKDAATTTASTSISNDTTITSEGNAFQLHVTSRACVIAKVAEGAKGVQAARPLYACAEKTQDRHVQESYYLVGQTLGNASSPFSDSDGNTETSWRMLIRGRATSDAVNQFLTTHNGVKMMIFRAPGRAMLSNFTVQEAPGLLSDDE